RWYRLRSKPGRKEKERGEIEVDIQFMRSNMTASMFDLSVKDKARSPFGKLKAKLRGKRSSGLSDTASAVLPSSGHSSADSEEESVEKEKKKSKFKALFARPGLHKSSLSQSLSVLPTQQPVTERVLLRPSDFQSQWDDEESEASPTSDNNSLPSPLFKSRKPAALDRQLHQVTSNHGRREGLSLFSGLKSRSDPVSKSSLCINGSHVYMEESTGKDSTPASSPSPHNFRKKQLFASEENLSSRSAKGPEEAGRTSPGPAAFSGSASLETFKSVSLPSYRLLSSEEYLEPGLPASVEAIHDTRRPDHRKPALPSLAAGKKEAVKGADAESAPDRTLEDEGNKDPGEKSEQEAKPAELPADSSRENPAEESPRAEDAPARQQPLSPSEEELKPGRASAPAKTRAVKPRLGLSSAEEAKATLPAFPPAPLPALLSVPPSSSDSNPFISKSGQKALLPDAENQSGSAASLASPAAEHLTSRNPFAAEWDRAATALDPADMPSFPAARPLAASAPREPLAGLVSGNNPFSSEWGKSWQGQGPESSHPKASPGLSRPSVPSLPSSCHFNTNNPFVPQPGREADAPGLRAVASPSPFSLPCVEVCSSAEPSAELKPSARGAAGTPSAVALASDVGVASDPLDAPSDSPGLALKQQPESPQLRVEGPVQSRETALQGGVNPEQAPSAESEREEEQEGCGEKGPAAPAASLEPQAGGPFAQVGSAPSAAHRPPPGVAAVGRAGGEGLVPPKGALSKSPRVPQAREASSDSPGAKPTPGPPVPNGRGSDARGCLPQSSSLETLPPPLSLRDDGGSSSRRLRNEGDGEVLERLPSPRAALPVAGDRGLRLAALPVIPEGGSDEELLGDCQDSRRVTVQDVPEAARMPSCGELEGRSAAAHSTVAALGGGGGGGGLRAPGRCEAGEWLVPPARAAVQGVHQQVADSDSAVASPSRERKSRSEGEDGAVSAGAEERVECGLSEPAVSSSSPLSSPSQPYPSSRSLPSDPPNHRAESPQKPTAEGSAAKAANCGKKKLLQARVSPSEPFPSLSQQSAEPGSPKHRLHPVKPLNAAANGPQSRNLNVLSTMNEKLLEMKVKKYDPAEPAYAYAQLTHDELIQLVLRQKDTISRKDLQVRELEDYIDNLLVRVMEETPSILRVPASGSRKAGKM
ncbi:RFIP1 protein, partial [Upupa epops]|nr:RFIP1 protein [Upupa epops]